MITAISTLESNVLKSIFVLAQKKENINFPKELLVSNGVLKSNQLTAVLNNLTAKGIIEVNLDLFGYRMVSMTFDGVKFCQKLSSKRNKK